ncbi:hypothetical protein [Brevundimonas sp. R86498]|uniref:hypothetical protein n=1 Tax=Brevundimonas sp. R86498 TaxID=3093845 RepID=UPI0037C85CEF
MLVASWLIGSGGCASVPEAAPAAEAPIAPRIAALVEANRVYPRWADFPRATESLPEPAEVAARVGSLRGTGDSLASEAARIEWTLQDPATFVAEVNSRMDARAMAPLSVQTPEEIEAFAEQTRRRGAAPPPVDRSSPR